MAKLMADDNMVDSLNRWQIVTSTTVSSDWVSSNLTTKLGGQFKRKLGEQSNLTMKLGGRFKRKLGEQSISQ